MRPMPTEPHHLSPILEYDPNPNAIIQPQGPELSESVPERAVLCFFLDVLNHLRDQGQLVEIGVLGSEMGRNPVYRLEHQGQRLLIVHPGVGAALAVGFTEELIAIGVDKFIACGGCGVLDKSVAVGYPVILTSAVRDEGTSYHYLPPAREAAPAPRAVAALEQTCRASQQPYRLGKAWTTDGFYRETAVRRERRQAEGCLVVEMEAAAFFALAEFRQVTFGQVVYGGDLVVPEGWDKRSWHNRTDDRLRLFWLAVEAACLL
jgi:uridine phosphorylase